MPFTSRIPSSRHLIYPDRHAILDLEPFEVRRLGFDVHMQYKFFNGIAAISKADRFKYSNRTSLFTGSGGPKLVKSIRSGGHTGGLRSAVHQGPRALEGSPAHEAKFLK